jgi:hypothetical protein
MSAANGFAAAKANANATPARQLSQILKCILMFPPTMLFCMYDIAQNDRASK